MTTNSLARQSTILVTIAGAITLSIESFLSLQNKSLCKTEACAVVSKYLTISESFLVSAGALYFWILALIIFFSERYPKIKYLPFFLLAPALAFDSTLIGFQIFTIQQKCILCITVAAFLVLITFLFCFSRKSFVILICFIFVWLGGFGVNKFIAMPTPQGAYYNMAFYSTGNKKLTTQNFSPQMTLIFSMNCSHCLKVIRFLANNYPTDVNIKLASIDSDHKSLSQLSLFLRQVSSDSNPFSLLGDIKEKKISTDAPISKNLKIQSKNALSFLSNLGITNIPVLVADISNKEKKVLISVDKIIPFLDKTINLHP